jgi:3-methylcrotonyl-CoA carboxylase beta subunit
VNAPTLNTILDRESSEAKARFIRNQALATELRARVAEAALGGNEKSRERLLDAGSPVLEIGQLAACDLYGGEVPGAGMIANIGAGTNEIRRMLIGRELIGAGA